MLAVGAAKWSSTYSIKDSSSRGPLPFATGVTKPDIVGATDVSTRSISSFSGTSAAAPHIAGMAALILQRYPSYTPKNVADYLRNRAERRGTRTPNNTWGYGFAKLPAIPTPTPTATTTSTPRPAPTTTATLPPSSDGSWSTVITVGKGEDGDEYGYKLRRFGAITDSTLSHGGTTYKIYTFKWEDEDESDGYTDDITIYLRNGCLRPSDIVSLTVGSQTYNGVDRQHYRDAECDVENPPFTQQIIFDSPGNNPFSPTGAEITVTLNFASGSDTRPTATATPTSTATTTATAAATTATATDTPTPTATTTPIPTPTATATATPAPCGVASLGTFSDELTRSGSWSSGCDSVNRPGKYARYYSFSLSNSAQVTIELTSATDPYLFLLSGNGKNGSVLTQNDDIDPLTQNYNSRISRTLGREATR